MKQLQELAGAQGQINEQSLKLMPGEGGKPLQMSGRQQHLKRLAAEQRAIQEAFENMHEQYGDSKSLGRMGNIGEEMREVVKDLEKMRVDRKTIERQQRILTRMLDAQKSVREKEYSRERKAETGKQYARKSPDENQESIDRKLKQLQTELLKALREGYNPDYEKVIEEYFKTLNQEYLKK
jgi:hypothetical protein